MVSLQRQEEGLGHSEVTSAADYVRKYGWSGILQKLALVRNRQESAARTSQMTYGPVPGHVLGSWDQSAYGGV